MIIIDFLVQGGSSSRVVNQLLTEMDGLETRDCFMLAATNRPDMLDPAILRPGRFDKVIVVGLPGSRERLEILETITKRGTRPPLAGDVDLNRLASDERLDGFTGADLSALVREASLAALKERVFTRSRPGENVSEHTSGLERMSIDEEGDNLLEVNDSHFTRALDKVRASVSKSERVRYERMIHTYSAQKPKPDK